MKRPVKTPTHATKSAEPSGKHVMQDLSHDAPPDVTFLVADKSALAVVFAQYRDRLCNVLRFRIDQRLVCRVDADDLLQEAYIRAVQRLSHFTSKHGPQSDTDLFLWLRRIVLQTLYDAHRRHIGAQKRDARRQIGLDGNGSPVATSVSIVQGLAAGLTSPSQAVAKTEVSQQLHTAIRKMSNIDQEVIALRHFEELSNSEVAHILGIEEKTASIRYVRAIQRLRNILTTLPDFGDCKHSSRDNKTIINDHAAHHGYLNKEQ